MAEEQLRIELDYTYTYDQFTVFFYGDQVFVGRKDYPIGQCCVDVMNLEEPILNHPCRPEAAHRKNRQRRRPRAGTAERCLGTYLCFAGLP